MAGTSCICHSEFTTAAVHAWSRRAGALCGVDCGAIPESLFESTFFGHRRGAFTGATEAREGEIVRADGGTLMLDEVANMSPTAQSKLLRVIETGQVTPLGGTEAISVDVRWIAATNRDLMADPGSFRPDLLRRLAGYVARIPPLRERREDLGELTAHLLRDAGATRAAITMCAARALFTSGFPGNIRQLRATLRTALTLAGDGVIEERHLGEEPATGSPTPDDADAGAVDSAPARRTTGPGRRAAPGATEVIAMLDAHGGNVVRTAAALGTHPRQLYRWIERHGIDLDRYRDRS